MKTINKILVPVDFSDNSRVAIEMAVQIAESFGAQIIFFHAIELPRVIKGEVERRLPLVQEYERRARETAERELAALLKQYGNGRFTIVVESAEGQPFIEIIKAAKKHVVDLVVMGTHGFTGLKHMLIGSVAEKVVRKSPCPVLTVKHPDYEFEMP